MLMIAMVHLPQEAGKVALNNKAIDSVMCSLLAYFYYRKRSNYASLKK